MCLYSVLQSTCERGEEIGQLINVSSEGAHLDV